MARSWGSGSGRQRRRAVAERRRADLDGTDARTGCGWRRSGCVMRAAETLPGACRRGGIPCGRGERVAPVPHRADPPPPKPERDQALNVIPAAPAAGRLQVPGQRPRQPALAVVHPANHRSHDGAGLRGLEPGSGRRRAERGGHRRDCRLPQANIRGPMAGPQGRALARVRAVQVDHSDRAGAQGGRSTGQPVERACPCRSGHRQAGRRHRDRGRRPPTMRCRFRRRRSGDLQCAGVELPRAVQPEPNCRPADTYSSRAASRRSSQPVPCRSPAVPCRSPR